MSPLQWSCGFINSVLKQSSDQVQKNLLSLAAGLYQNALDLGWPIARGAYKVILTEMEAGRVAWTDMQGIQELRQQYAQRCITKANSAAGASGPAPPGGPHKGNAVRQADKGGNMPCPAYQSKSYKCGHW